MPVNPLSAWLTACILLGIRFVPVLAFAPPFSLLHVPRSARVLLGLGLAVCMVGALPLAPQGAMSGGALAAAAVRELMLGILIALAFQFAFAALQLAGRTLDIQAGFGLATVLDPATNTPSPLIGTMLAYAAGAAFFAFDGHLELVRFLAATAQAIPPGTWSMPHAVLHITAFFSALCVTAFGAVGIAVLALFLADLAIALLSRTVPQMNVLVLGFQVKTLLLLFVLPVALGASGALLARMMADVLQALPALV